MKVVEGVGFDMQTGGWMYKRKLVKTEFSFWSFVNTEQADTKSEKTARVSRSIKKLAWLIACMVV